MQINAKDINQIIKSLNVNMAKGPDGITPKFVKMSADIIDCHIAIIINKDISNNKFSENAKTTVRPIFKKGVRTEIKNYRPVCLLNIFTKTYERFLHDNLTNYVDTFLSKFISAYRKSYSSNHVLIRLIESWEKRLHQKVCRCSACGFVKSFRFYTAWPSYCKDAYLRFFKEFPRILLFILKKKKTKR